MRALVLDADPSASYAIKLMLKAGNIVADCFPGVTGALELEHRGDYDILLLDPGGSDDCGYRLLRRMRSLDRPILVLSRSHKPQAWSAAVGAGANGFLTKPFDRTELLDCIHHLLLVRSTKGRSGVDVRGRFVFTQEERYVTVPMIDCDCRRRQKTMCAG